VWKVSGCAAGTLAVVLVIEAISRYVLFIPNPDVFYTLCVVCAGFFAGWPGGLAALAVALACGAWRFSLPPTTLRPDHGVAIRVGVYSLGTILTGLFVCALKSKVDRALTASEGRFEALVRTAPYGIFVQRDERIAYVNEAARALFRARLAQELIGTSMWDRIHPDDRDLVRGRVATIMQQGGAPLIEEQFVAVDGTVFDAEVVAARCEFERRPAVLMMFRDAGPRRSMERRIERQLADLSLLQEVSRAMLFGMTPPEIAQYVTALLVERLGIATAGIAVLAEEGEKERAFSADRFTWAGAALSPPCCTAADGDATRRAVDDARAVVVNGAAAGGDGTSGYRAMAAFPLISADRVLGVLNVYADSPGFFDRERTAQIQSLANLTAIALSEAAGREQVRRRAADLSRSQTRLELAMAAGRMGTFEWDLDTDVIVWDGQHARLFGLRPEEFDGRYATFAARIHPDDLPEMERKVARARDARELFEHEYRAVWPDGSVRWIVGRGTFSYDASGAPTRMSGVVMDVTPRRAAEETARTQQSELAHLLRLNLLSQLVSGLAHEINQPLSAISNFAGAGLTMREKGNLTVDGARELLSEIDRESHRAAEIIRRLRGFMKKRRPEVAPVDLNAVVGEALALMQGELQRNRVGVTRALAANLPPVRIDAVQVQQVLVNLIQNAIDAMADVPPARRSIAVSTIGALEAVIVRVSDGGTGIPADAIARVFDSFYSTKSHGLGMGLNISRSIVESHGGRLTAVNNPRGGATFEFVLPLTAAAAAAGERSA
jgi:PAS domain S-box-containing protein